MMTRLLTAGLGAVLFVALFLSGLRSCPPAWALEPAHPLERAIGEGWQFRWGQAPGVAPEAPSDAERRDLGALREPPGREGRAELWQRVKLPEAAWHNQWLFVHEMNHVFTASVGKDVIYRYGQVVPGSALKAPGLRWHMIPISGQMAGKTLVLHSFSDDVGYIGPFGYVGLGTPEEHLTRMMRRDMGRIVVSALSAFIGLLAFVVYFGKRRAGEYVYFALFALVGSMYVLCRTEIRTVLWDAPWFWMRLEIVAVALMPTLLLFHLQDIFHPRFRRGLAAMGWACAGMAAATVGLDVLGLYPIYNSLHWLLFELLILSPVVMVMAAWSVFDGLFEAKLVSVGVLFAVFLASQAGLASLKIVPWQLHLAHWAILLLILSLGVVLIRRFILVYFEVERSLKDRDAHLSAIIDALPDSFLLTSRDGRILEHRLLEEDRDALTQGRPMGSAIQGSLAESLATPLGDIHRQDPAAISVFEAHAPGRREPAFFEVRVVPVGVDRCLALMRNITDRKRFERMSREFVAMVSHELRTPLTVIKGTLGLLQGEALSSTLMELVANARNNTDRLTRLVNDLLDSQMIEAGHFTVHRQPVTVAAVVERAIALNRPFAEAFQVDLVLGGAVPDLILEVDEDRLIQALTNLLTNAAKFSSTGGTVTVAAEVREDRLRFAVTDHGPGVPEEFQGRIFQKFTQADSSSTRSRGGSGLGLSIAKAIVERHGGLVGFTTSEGEGSTFFIDLPLPESAAAVS